MNNFHDYGTNRPTGLQSGEERYQKMIAEVQDYAILLLNTEGTILNWNKGAEKIKGYRQEEIVGKNFSIFYLEEDRRRDLPGELIRMAVRNGRAMHEGWRLRKDGERFWGSIVITALHSEDGSVIGFSKVTRDLTEKKKADDQLQQYAQELESRNKELEQFANVASHDLKEPLRKISLYADMLHGQCDDKAAMNRTIVKIREATARMGLLINGILEYSQLSRGSQLYKTVDLNETLDQVLESYELMITEKNVRVIRNELPVVSGIPIQLQQLFSNLLGNAIKFSGEKPVVNITGGMAGEAETRELRQVPEGYVKLVFADNGSGFDPSFSSQVFEMFRRFNAEKQGTGIGLAICKKVVENHQGAISVLTEPGKGTSFSVFLPAGRGEGS